jgi:hypothetical protein
MSGKTGRAVVPGALTRMLTKISVSVAFGLVAFLLSLGLDSNIGNQILVGIGASIFISGIAFVVQFLIEVEERLDAVEDALERTQTRYEDHHQDLRETLRAEFIKINMATELFARIESSGVEHHVVQLARNSAGIENGSPPLIVDFAQHEIGRLAGYLKGLSEGGNVTYEGEDRDWLLGLTRVARHTIDTTSLTTVDAGGQSFADGGLWTSELGHVYLAAQRDAIRRGVRIRRIFVIDRPSLEDDPNLLNILRQHSTIGVQVRLLRPRVDDGPWRDIDVVLVDGMLSYQSTPASRVSEISRPVIVATTLVTDPQRVADRIARFTELWDSAEPVPDIPLQRHASDD